MKCLLSSTKLLILETESATMSVGYSAECGVEDVENKQEMANLLLGPDKAGVFAHRKVSLCLRCTKAKPAIRVTRS